MNSIELKKVIQATLKGLEDHQRFGILFDLILEECKTAQITREAFLEIVSDVMGNPVVYDDFKDSSVVQLN